jgi:hypothetical protein
LQFGCLRRVGAGENYPFNFEDAVVRSRNFKI